MKYTDKEIKTIINKSSIISNSKSYTQQNLEFAEFIMKNKCKTKKAEKTGD